MKNEGKMCQLAETPTTSIYSFLPTILIFQYSRFTLNIFVSKPIMGNGIMLLFFSKTKAVRKRRMKGEDSR